MNKYKDREVNLNKPVEMYRCLNRKGFTFSIRQDGVVVGHVKDSGFVLKNCEFVVNESGKKRCITQRQRNVHAFVRGYITEKDDLLNSFSHILHYYPYNEEGFCFYLADSRVDVKQAKRVYLQKGRIYLQT